MAYDIKSFRAWATYYDVAQELNEKEQGLFYRALFEYMFVGNDLEEKLPKMARICFKSIKPNLKRSKSKAKANEDSADCEEMTLSTSHVNGTKIALNLNSNLNIRSKGHDGESGASVAGPPSSIGNDVTFPCPHCHAPATGYWSESLGKYSARCSDPLCGADFVISAEAVAAAIGGEAS